MKLYLDSHWISPYAFSAHVALTEKGLPFEVQELAFDRQEQKQADYSAKSYTGRIPALVHGDFWLAESSAIVEYLDDAFPAPTHARLLPSDVKERGLARMIMAFVRSDLGALREERPTTTMFYERASKPLSTKGEEAAAKLIRFTESLLSPGARQLFGAWSIADADLAFMLQRLLMNGHAVPSGVRAYVDHQWSRPSLRPFLDHKRRPFTPYSY